jgi:hypothetical protein
MSRARLAAPGRVQGGHRAEAADWPKVTVTCWKPSDVSIPVSIPLGVLVVALIILSLMFGGFQKGTKSGGLAPRGPLCTSCG